MYSGDNGSGAQSNHGEKTVWKQRVLVRHWLILMVSPSMTGAVPRIEGALLASLTAARRQATKATDAMCIVIRFLFMQTSIMPA